MTKSKSVKWTVLGVLSGLGAIVLLGALGFLIYLTTFHCDWGRVYNHYVETESEYYSMEVTLKETKYFDRYKECYLYIKAPYEHQFVICEKNYQMLVHSDFFDVVSEDTVITIYTHSYTAWDGWDFPIVGIAIGDKVYVDFDTGKQNWLDELRQRSEENGFLQTPIN